MYITWAGGHLRATRRLQGKGAVAVLARLARRSSRPRSPSPRSLRTVAVAALAPLPLQPSRRAKVTTCPRDVHQRASPLECRPLRGCGRPASGPATAEVGAWNWAPRLHGASCWSAGCWRNRREVTDHRDGTPCDAQRLVLLLRVSTYVLFIERSSARCACRESREGGTVISRLPLQRLQARSRAVRNRGVGGTPASPHVDAHHVGLMLPGVRRCTPMRWPHAVPQA